MTADELAHLRSFAASNALIVEELPTVILRELLADRDRAAVLEEQLRSLEEKHLSALVRLSDSFDGLAGRGA